MPESGEMMERQRGVREPVAANARTHRNGDRPGDQHQAHPRVQANREVRLFESFWMGGFESATHVNVRGRRLDMIALTQHDRHVQGDYARLREVGLRTAREGVRWHLIEQRPGRYDFSSLRPMLDAARESQVQVIWNLLHYGWPDHLDLFGNDFVDRFAAFCREAAQYIAENSILPPVYVPINEISFLTWAVEREGFILPTVPGCGGELKRRLVRATIAASEAIWSVDLRARLATVEPIIHVVPPRDRPDLVAAAARQNESQFEAWDLLCGRLEPELGGHPKYLDLLGVNYYHSNQFEHPDIRLRWEDVPLDDRWVPLHRLLASVQMRYGRPMFMAETSHFGVGRAAWIGEIAAEIMLARLTGLPIHGVCLYPIIDRPDWNDTEHWHHSGLWDLVRQTDGTLARQINEPYAIALRAAQHLIPDL